MWSPKDLPQVYYIANHLKQPVPYVEKAGLFITTAEDLNLPLTEDFITHLSACILDLAKRAHQSSKSRNTSNSASLKSSNRSISVSHQQLSPRSTKLSSMQMGGGGVGGGVTSTLPVGVRISLDSDSVNTLSTTGDFIQSFDEGMGVESIDFTVTGGDSGIVHRSRSSEKENDGMNVRKVSFHGEADALLIGGEGMTVGGVSDGVGGGSHRSRGVGSGGAMGRYVRV